MNRILCCCQRCAITLTLLLSSHAKSQEAPVDSVVVTSKRVAGRTLDETASQLNDENRTVRLRAVKSLGAFGASGGAKLSDALNHDDKAMRYVAAVQLGRLGGEPLKKAIPDLEKLMQDKSSAAVQIAAAFAICRHGESQEALALLIERVQLPDRATACSTAELIGMLGKQAESTKQVLFEISEANPPSNGGDYHIGGAARKAIRQIESDSQAGNSK